MVECAITKRASLRGLAGSSRTSTLTPLKTVSNFDHVVTQWMSPVNVDRGSAWISSQVQVVGVSTSPSTVIVQVAVSRRGVASAVRTGQPAPVSYWPGGSRPSGPSGRLRKKPRVTGMGARYSQPWRTSVFAFVLALLAPRDVPAEVAPELVGSAITAQHVGAAAAVEDDAPVADALDPVVAAAADHLRGPGPEGKHAVGAGTAADQDVPRQWP